MANEGRLVHYSGQVQGVGFRYTTMRIAGGYPSVAGRVMNLPDGRVELVAEGPSSDVAAFLSEVSQAMGAFIRDERAEPREVTGGFRGFGVR